MEHGARLNLFLRSRRSKWEIMAVNSPTEIVPKILVHFGATRMNGKLREMCFIQDSFLQFMIFGNDQAILKPQNPFRIHTDTLVFIFSF